MLLSAVSVLVVAQLSSEIPEGLMNNPVYANLLLLQNMQVVRPVLFFVRTSRSGVNPIFLTLKHFIYPLTFLYIKLTENRKLTIQSSKNIYLAAIGRVCCFIIRRIVE